MRKTTQTNKRKLQKDEFIQLSHMLMTAQCIEDCDMQVIGDMLKAYLNNHDCSAYITDNVDAYIDDISVKAATELRFVGLQFETHFEGDDDEDITFEDGDEEWHNGIDY
jgi:2C-methyl-D-erythritol 2,4-cyclodiphosphate synthase